MAFMKYKKEKRRKTLEDKIEIAKYFLQDNMTLTKTADRYNTATPYMRTILCEVAENCKELQDDILAKMNPEREHTSAVHIDFSCVPKVIHRNKLIDWFILNYRGNIQVKDLIHAAETNGIKVVR